MPNPINFYMNTSETDELVERYGECLEDMSLRSLLAFRAVVGYLSLQYRAEFNYRDDWSLLVQLSTQHVAPYWHEVDFEAFQLSTNLLTEEVDGRFVATRFLDPLNRALTDCIECHQDY